MASARNSQISQTILLLTIVLVLLVGKATFAIEQIDQSNLPAWAGGWTHVNPTAEGRAAMWQTFTPSRPNLTTVEIDILTISPGDGDDTLTVEIAKDGDILATAERYVEDGSDGLLRFEFSQIVLLVPEEIYELMVRDTGTVRFGWKYASNTYERGSRYVAAQERPGTDWLFQTYSETEPAQTKYSGGTGEPNNPYQIATAEDLILLGDSPDDYDKHFILTADIDLDPNLPGRKVFDKAVIAPDPDPNDDYSRYRGPEFQGVFNGNGHTISQLTIEGERYLGLFGILDSAKISNLGLEAVNVNGTGESVGSLAGYIHRSDITTCYSTGTVRGNVKVGGLVGYNDWWSNITTCCSTGIVSGNGSVGGLVGYNYWGDITASYSTGIVDANEGIAGGLVGDNGGEVIACYSTAIVTGKDGVGGLAGINNHISGGRTSSPVGRISYCYSAGSVSGTSSVGGLVGSGNGEITSCLWDTKTSGQTISAGGIGKNTEEMQIAETFLEADWDFVDETDNGTEDIWWIDEGVDYPHLWWEAE